MTTILPERKKVKKELSFQVQWRRNARWCCRHECQRYLSFSIAMFQQSVLDLRIRVAELAYFVYIIEEQILRCCSLLLVGSEIVVSIHRKQDSSGDGKEQQPVERSALFLHVLVLLSLFEIND